MANALIAAGEGAALKTKSVWKSEKCPRNGSAQPRQSDMTSPAEL